MMESLLTYLSYFVMSFSVLSMVRLSGNFISSLLSNPPKRFVLNDRELVYHGLTLSYVITFIIISLL